MCRRTGRHGFEAAALGPATVDPADETGLRFGPCPLSSCRHLTAEPQQPALGVRETGERRGADRRRLLGSGTGRDAGGGAGGQLLCPEGALSPLIHSITMWP